MDFRNVLMAIVLSTLVLIVWATFFEAPIVEQQNVENQIEKKESTSTPSIEEMESSKKISRNEALDRAVQTVEYAKSLNIIVAITKSAKGSVIINNEEVVEVKPAKVDRVVDTTGAGDLYAGGFLFGMSNG